MTYSAAFHPPIARVCEKDTGPSPNQYHAEKYNTGRWNNVSADSAFKSRSFNRAMINMKEVGPKPSPCHYNVNDRLTHERIKEPVSYCFKSVTGRAFPPKPNSVPGPAKYRPNEPIEPVARTLLPHQHYLRLAAPPVLKPDKTVYPGPTTYDIPRSLDNLDKCRQSAAFILPMSGCALQLPKKKFPARRNIALDRLDTSLSTATSKICLFLKSDNFKLDRVCFLNCILSNEFLQNSKKLGFKK